MPNLPFSVFDTQRRIHPSISELVQSTLYPTLANSNTVAEYPRVPGITKRLFWLHHKHPKSGWNNSQDTIKTSYSNEFEIDMVSALVSYLIRQGVYKSGEIAVLTPYLGQFKKFQQKLGSSMQIIVNDRDTEDLASLEVDVDNKLSKNKKSPAKISALDGIRAATVDNFQGEEADVVIVSLVRSNKEKKCGFFSVSNRINVLLSRARYGIYIIGNSHTCSNVPIWTQVIEILGHKSNIGRELELQYPKHPETRNLVSQPDHFVQFSPNGGCNRRGGVGDFAFDQAAIQMGSLIEASALGLQCDILLISDYIDLCRKSADGSRGG
ncbi:hypothetical protein PoMZ_01685 [Pyricularia oryzae]|uniref:DNA2/NAM7 helicase-like C-terminal domain-containing protein n=1 Tax=Pyricularia oryzae TaxID=318829 RepID=A0A4P7N2Y8_PYROR|nr:hypothetical protein PoMZ_01685 [Pyricularia oryzae]